LQHDLWFFKIKFYYDKFDYLSKELDKLLVFKK